MAQTEHALATEQPPAPSPRVEGWVQYYEYFHKLNDDMQHTSEAAAQRRASPSGSGPPPPFPKRDLACFELIAAAIKKHDKPLVQIEDGSDGLSKPDDDADAPSSGRKLTEDDLALVRAQLRAAAQATNAQAAAQEGRGEEEEEEEHQSATAELAAAAANSRRSSRKGAVDPTADPSAKANTCAAAIETLLWFGLALGDKEKEGKEDKGAKSSSKRKAPLAEWTAGVDEAAGEEDDYLSENGSLATVAMAGVAGLEDLGDWDWEQAMREAGIDEDAPASASSSRPLTPQELSSALLEDVALGDGDAAAPATAAAAPAERRTASEALTVKIPEAPMEGVELARFDSISETPLDRSIETARFDSASEGSATSDGTPSEAGERTDGERTPTPRGGAAESDDTRSVVSGEGEEGADADADGGASSGRTTPRVPGYSSPDSNNRSAISASTRRSAREPKPKGAWAAAMAAPLLKWEKEQQEKPNRPKRRSSGRAGEARGDELGFDTDSGEELVHGLVLPNGSMLSPTELVDESVLDLVFGEAKRQRC